MPEQGRQTAASGKHNLSVFSIWMDELVKGEILSRKWTPFHAHLCGHLPHVCIHEELHWCTAITNSIWLSLRDVGAPDYASLVTDSCSTSILQLTLHVGCFLVLFFCVQVCGSSARRLAVLRPPHHHRRRHLRHGSDQRGYCKCKNKWGEGESSRKN